MAVMGRTEPYTRFMAHEVMDASSSAPDTAKNSLASCALHANTLSA